MTIEVEKKDGVATIWLDRPAKLNAFSEEMWRLLPDAAQVLAADPEVRVLVIAGRGPCFTVGIDLEMLAGLVPAGDSEAARRMGLMKKIKELQQTFTSLAECPQPVIAAVHGYCLGAGIDLTTACDIRWASSDAIFSVRETRMGIVADVGTMQRLPRLSIPAMWRRWCTPVPISLQPRLWKWDSSPKCCRTRRSCGRR